MGKTRRRLKIAPSIIAALFLALIAAGCSGKVSEVPLDIPRGALSRLEVKVDGNLYGFGPFVGYYFRPLEAGRFDRLEVWCFNERSFYTTDIPANALLFTGEARLTTLPPIKEKVPTQGGRIRPVFFDEAPPEWLESRPKPKEEFLHFHSMYDREGPVFSGYWVRHVGEASFTYDMGGRVRDGSPLYHEVIPGVDLGFARIVEFDHGPWVDGND